MKSRGKPLPLKIEEKKHMDRRPHFITVEIYSGQNTDWEKLFVNTASKKDIIQNTKNS